MKIFVPFEEALVEDLVLVGDAIVPFRLESQRGRVNWNQVEILEDHPATATGAPLAAVELAAIE